MSIASDTSLQEFLAQTAGGITDEAGLDHALQAAVACVRESLHPLGMHVRVLDRNSSALVKRCGFGPYYEVAPKERRLRHDGIGSVNVASTRKGCWTERAEMAEIGRLVGRELSADQTANLQRITGYVTLPLLWMDRVLGTLSVHFDHDSPFSPAEGRFVEVMAWVLGSALGSLQWARERAAIVRFWRDLDRMMFRRPEFQEEETSVLAQVTRAAFELTTAAVVAYYRHDTKSRKLELLAFAAHGNPAADVSLPEVVPEGVGVVSLATASKRPYLVDVYRAGDCQEVRSQMVVSLPHVPEDEFCHWVRSEIAQPVIVNRTVQGVLLALSPIPHGLVVEDADVVRGFALKIGVWLEAKLPTPEGVWQRVEASLNQITAAMARSSDVGELYRLLLLAITTGEALGFSRAVLFLQEDEDEDRFVTTAAVGPRTNKVAENQWDDADAKNLDEKIQACERIPDTRPGDLREVIAQLVLDLGPYPEIRESFKAGELVVRRKGRSDVIGNARFPEVLSAEDKPEGEYVLAPLVAGDELAGVVFADRRFLTPPDIAQETLDLLRLLTRDFGRILKALRLREEEQETRAAKALAWGVSYSLRTRAAALESWLSILRHDLGGSHEKAIKGIQRGLEFFKQAGTRASKHLRLWEARVGTGEKVDLNTVLAELVNMLMDSRVQPEYFDRPVCVQAESRYIEDILLEVLWNACEFTDPQAGRIKISVRAEEGTARVDCVDNGKGIPPAFRPDLFKPFKCFPTTRMGLGLSYAARLVSAYRGTIEEIGTWEQGAHFVVRIPLLEDQCRA